MGRKITMKTQVIANIVWDNESKQGGKVNCQIIAECEDGSRDILHTPAFHWGSKIRVSPVDRTIYIHQSKHVIGVVRYDILRESTKQQESKELEEILSQ